MNTDIIDQIIIMYPLFVRCVTKTWNTIGQCINYLLFKHAYQTVRRKVLCGGFGGLEVACWPLVPKFAGSNPAEAVGFFRAKKSSARLLSDWK